MNTQSRIPKSFYPSYADEQSVRRSYVRAITAHAWGSVHHELPGKVLQRTWPDDDRAAMVLRAAQNPTDTSAFPTHDLITAFRSLAPGSAALRLFDTGMKLDMSGVTTIKIPHVAGLPTQPVFVAEGQPAPVVSWTLAAATIGPVKKILIMSAVTNELENATPESAAQVIGRVLADASNRSIDATAFGTAAGTTAQPAGLLNGVTPLTPTAGGGFDQMVADLAGLITAIGAAGIDPTGTVFVAAPHQAVTMKAKLGLKFDYPIMLSLGLPDKTVAAFAPAAIASGYQGQPQIETGRDAVMHMEDTTPHDITGGTPSPAVPVKTMFQTNTIAIKVRAEAAWGCLPGGAQVVNNVTW